MMKWSNLCEFFCVSRTFLVFVNSILIRGIFVWILESWKIDLKRIPRTRLDIFPTYRMFKLLQLAGKHYHNQIIVLGAMRMVCIANSYIKTSWTNNLVGRFIFRYMFYYSEISSNISRIFLEFTKTRNFRNIQKISQLTSLHHFWISLA